MDFPPVEEQLAVIRRGIEKIVPEQELAKKLEESRKTGTPLRIKYGIDPTGVDLHLGHTVPMRKMSQFQELGHQAVIIIGNYTALVGDPSGRDEARAKRLTADDVERNAQDYLEQVAKVIDIDKAEVHRNGDWFGEMSFADILNLTSKVTVAQLLTRDDFAKRMKAESPIFLHECLYPIMQAWDSVMIHADIELGGTEQLYSFMLARDLQKDAGKPEQIGVMSPILVGIDGVRRMGKSLGNYIGFAEPPYEQMKKFMQVPDECMKPYFELLTQVPLAEVEQLLAGHPKEAKLTLAKTVIGEYHGADAAEEAAERWTREISKGALPEDIPESELSSDQLQDGGLPAAKLLTELSLVASGGEARRLIAQGGAKVGEDKRVIGSHDEIVPLTDGELIWAGKKKVKRVRLT
ncbi:tyrosine--tRNA ligase [Stratiformator vulcanicus]|uniref:Tyrosine--tRNA ligase n=1 Tax=Stratiformator vulcanicus TaxID=2527980 RepID=A0A517R3E5_9PLAN|nr:tyrosine--tRNA ligase [Stratiformator vulcanicus]QDT38425.1 Tyrosine--tRNA ligase [Stratiformator vulcanicus]